MEVKLENRIVDELSKTNPGIRKNPDDCINRILESFLETEIGEKSKVDEKNGNQFTDGSVTEYMEKARRRSEVRPFFDRDPGGEGFFDVNSSTTDGTSNHGKPSLKQKKRANGSGKETKTETTSGNPTISGDGSDTPGQRGEVAMDEDRDFSRVEGTDGDRTSRPNTIPSGKNKQKPVKGKDAEQPEDEEPVESRWWHYKNTR
ncbi:MAG: hypothetical protein ABEK59_04765 [Halobacteria archaeon]